jgi:two-component system, OmpR family, response regulator
MESTILIVDDSPLIVDGLAALLTRKGYSPLAAHGGDECIQILQAVTPDLILLDIMMEPMDGWETLEKIKENPATKEIPVLMFSAKKITPAEAQEHSINIDDFVSKPVSPSQLLNSIQRIFSRRNDVKGEILAAQNKGVDPAVIDEYCALRKRIEVDKNLLVVLRSSCGMDTPGRDVPREDVDAIRNLEDRIYQTERRLREISDLLAKTA